jgi:hypothetical protein
MDTILAEQGLRLSYLHDPSESEAFDPCRILDDLCDDGMSGAMLPWQNGLRMAWSDHLVLATGSNDGRCCGVVAASDLATEHEPFLFLDAAYLAPVARASQLLQRMLAFTMLRIAGDAAVPTVIAACVQTQCYARSLRDLGQRFKRAALFPAAPGDVVIDLGMASLARRIVRVVRPGSRYEAATGIFCSVGCTGAVHHAGGVAKPTPASSHHMQETLVVVDLSKLDEAAILDEARKLYRMRPKGGMRPGFVVAGTAPAPVRRVHDATALRSTPAAAP